MQMSRRKIRISCSSFEPTQIRPLRGFDRLQAAGFSEEDIASIRRQFHSESSSNFPDADLDGDDRECIFDCSS